MKEHYKIETFTGNSVCIFIDWFVPGFKAGGPIQSVANLVAHLSKHKTFYIVTRNTDYCETIPYENIEPNTWTKFSENVFVCYLSNDAINYKNIQKILTENKFETIYLNGIFSVWFTLIPLFICNRINHSNVIVGARGMLAPAALDIKKNKKKLFLFLSKLLGLYKHVTFHATNENEKKNIEENFGLKNKIVVAANLAKPLKENSNQAIEKVVGQLKLINIARVAPEKNLLFALESLLHAKANVEFTIYGPVYNESYWNECNNIIKQLPKNITINYKGAIENNKVQNEIAKHHFMFMPTLGENFGHIILESFQAARPVLISNLTPWKNLSTKNCGFDLELNSTKIFTEKIDELAKMNQLEFDELCKGALALALEVSTNEKDLQSNKLLFKIH